MPRLSFHLCCISIRKVGLIYSAGINSHIEYTILVGIAIFFINKGKNTPGVDKVLVKTFTARSRLVEELSCFTPWKAKPVKRVYIPKANKQEAENFSYLTLRFC